MFHLRGIYFSILAWNIVLSGTASLFEFCEHGNVDCEVLDSHCIRNVCKCRPNFFELDGKCWSVTNPRKICYENDDCHIDYGSQSLCKNSTCVCLPYFHQDSYGMCIKNRGFYETCRSRDQCYWGQDMENKIECINNTCVCKRGFMPGHNRKCVYSGSTEVVRPIMSSQQSIVAAKSLTLCMIVMHSITLLYNGITNY